MPGQTTLASSLLLDFLSADGASDTPSLPLIRVRGTARTASGRRRNALRKGVGRQTDSGQTRGIQCGATFFRRRVRGQSRGWFGTFPRPKLPSSASSIPSGKPPRDFSKGWLGGLSRGRPPRGARLHSSAPLRPGGTSSSSMSRPPDVDAPAESYHPERAHRDRFLPSPRGLGPSVRP